MAGECVTDPGIGGGRISDSIGSGEMESVSEWSRLRGTSRPLRASCMSSLTSLGGSCIEMVGFRLPGFTIGDCRTRLVGLLALDGILFVLRLLLCSAGWTIAGSPNISISTSIGEWPVELADVEA